MKKGRLQKVKKMLIGLKGQAAMEFLMTYGWAILVVLIVIGALAYFGVLSPSTLLPEKCTFPVSITCTDHSVGQSSITLILLNGAGRDMLVKSIAASSEALGVGNLGCACNTSSATSGLTLRNGASTTFTLDTNAVGNLAACNTAPGSACTFKDTGRDKNRYNISVFYSWVDSQAVTHTLAGELLGRKP